MADEVNKMGEGYTPPSPDVQKLDNLSDADLEAQLMTKLGGENTADESSQSNPDPTPVQTTSVAEPVKTEQVVVREEQKPVEQAEKHVEQSKPVPDVTFEQLQKKQGIKSPDELAKSYLELQRAFTQKRQAEAAQKVQPQTVQPVQTPVAQPQAENQFLNKFYENPELAIAEAFVQINQIANKPVYEELENLKRKTILTDLSSSPETQDFNNPDIQQGMIKEFEAHPDWMGDMNAHLKDAYYMARGKLANPMSEKAIETGKVIGEQSLKAKMAAGVESSSIPPSTPKFNPLTSDLGEVEARLNEAFKQAGRL